MRTLSNNGIIEDWTIRSGALRGKCPPLQFYKLRSLTCHARTELGLWKFLTGSQMPALRSFEYSNDDLQFLKKRHRDPILRFIESKTSLNSIYLSFLINVPFEFLLEIVEILKVPCTPKRPILKLYISPLKLNGYQVS